MATQLDDSALDTIFRRRALKTSGSISRFRVNNSLPCTI
jgi:hypothetical protein